MTDFDRDTTSDTRSLDQLVDEIHEQTPHLSIPRHLSTAECLRRVVQSGRLSVAGRHGEALEVCVAPEPSPQPLSQG